VKDLSISDINRLLDIVHLKKSNSLLSKVDEVATNSKLTVPVLTRLEERFGKVPLTSHQPSTPHDLSDISSQLSRIESLICSGYSASSIYDSVLTSSHLWAVLNLHLLDSKAMDLRSNGKGLHPLPCIVKQVNWKLPALIFARMQSTRQRASSVIHH
jgi:hypothetical protein